MVHDSEGDVRCTYLQSDVSSSQSRTVPSSPPDTMYCPSGDTEIARTGPLWPVCTARTYAGEEIR